MVGKTREWFRKAFRRSDTLLEQGDKHIENVYYKCSKCNAIHHYARTTDIHDPEAS